MRPFTQGYIRGYHQGYSEALQNTTWPANASRALLASEQYSSEVDAFSRLLCNERPIHVEDLYEDVYVDDNNTTSPHLELEVHPIKQTLTLSELMKPYETTSIRFQCNECCKTFASSDGVLKHYKKCHDTKHLIKNNIASYCKKHYSSK